MAKEIKYGYSYGPRCMVPNVRIGASEDFNHLGGNFVDDDASGNFEISAVGSDPIHGWAVMSEQDALASEGGTVASLDISCESVYRIPINAGTYDYTMRFKTCDLSVSGNMQGAVLNLSGEDTLIIVDGNNTDGWVDVKMNSNKMGSANAAGA